MLKKIIAYAAILIGVVLSITYTKGDLEQYHVFRIETIWCLLITFALLTCVLFKRTGFKVLCVIVTIILMFVTVFLGIYTDSMYGSEQFMAVYKGYQQVVKGNALFYVIPMPSLRSINDVHTDKFICKPVKNTTTLRRIINNYDSTIWISSIEKDDAIRGETAFKVTYNDQRTSTVYIEDKGNYAIFEVNFPK